MVDALGLSKVVFDLARRGNHEKKEKNKRNCPMMKFRMRRKSVPGRVGGSIQNNKNILSLLLDDISNSLLNMYLLVIVCTPHYNYHCVVESSCVCLIFCLFLSMVMPLKIDFSVDGICLPLHEQS